MRYIIRVSVLGRKKRIQVSAAGVPSLEKKRGGGSGRIQAEGLAKERSKGGVFHPRRKQVRRH